MKYDDMFRFLKNDVFLHEPKCSIYTTKFVTITYMKLFALLFYVDT